MMRLFKIKNFLWRAFLRLVYAAKDVASPKLGIRQDIRTPGEIDLMRIRDLAQSGWSVEIKDDTVRKRLVFTLHKRIGRTDKSVISVLSYEDILKNDVLMRSIMSKLIKQR